MKKLLFIVMVLTIFTPIVNGQIGQLGFNEYGIGGDLFIPQFPDRFKNTLGFGAGAHANYQFNSEFSLFTRVNYRNLKHEVLDLNSAITFQDVSVTLAGGLSLPELSNTRLLLGLQPSIVIAGSKASVYENLENIFTTNAFAGIQIELNQYSKLEFSYTLPVKKKNYDRYVDAVPPAFSVGLLLNFNRIGKGESDYEKMVRNKFELKKDTLYFINRSCEGELTDERLDELLAKYFTYCTYKVLPRNQLEKGALPSNPLNYAVIGQYYASKGEPLTTGIYLLDKNMQNVPYPRIRYTPIYNSTLNCMGEEKNIIRGIVNFNKALGN